MVAVGAVSHARSQEHSVGVIPYTTQDDLAIDEVRYSRDTDGRINPLPRRQSTLELTLLCSAKIEARARVFPSARQ